MNYRNNPSRIAALHRFALRRLGAAFLTGTQMQVDRWLAAVEQTKRRGAFLASLGQLMPALARI